MNVGGSRYAGVERRDNLDSFADCDYGQMSLVPGARPSESVFIKNPNVEAASPATMYPPSVVCATERASVKQKSHASNDRHHCMIPVEFVLNNPPGLNPEATM